MTRIHVSRDNIIDNRSRPKEEQQPVLIVHDSDDNVVRCNKVLIMGPSWFVYAPENPLDGITEVWLETDAKVIASD